MLRYTATAAVLGSIVYVVTGGIVVLEQPAVACTVLQEQAGWLIMLQVILEALDTHLVVFSPYISLTKLLESDPQLADLSQNAWAALNDVYRTDAPIVYAPHVLALGCLYLASVICSRDITAWLEGVEVDINQVRQACNSGC